MPPDNPHDPHDASHDDGDRPLRPPTDETLAQTDKLHVMAHEIANLIDGSMRCLELAWTALPDEATSVTIAQLDTARRQVETVRGALERMTDVLRSAMGGTVGRRFGALDNTMTLAEAINHAADVVRVAATEYRIELVVSVGDDVAHTPAAMIYPAVLNGLYNAIESIAIRGGSGRIELTATRNGNEAIVEIGDDGVGLDPSCTNGKAFDFGCTTKDDGDGLGLTVCRSVMDDLGGHVRLVTRHPDRVERRGAVLRFRFPAAAPSDQLGDWVGKPRSDETER